MEGKRIVKKHIRISMRQLLRSVKKVFGFDTLAELEREMNKVADTFYWKYGIFYDTISFDKINNYHDPSKRSELRELWARYITLKYFNDIGKEHLLFKHIILPKIKTEKGK